MRKAIVALTIIASLPILYVAGPLFLPGKAIAWIYYSDAGREQYLARHANDSWFKY